MFGQRHEAKPHGHADGVAVRPVHEADLRAALRRVGLVDADGVDPEVAPGYLCIPCSGAGQVVEVGPEVGPHAEGGLVQVS